MQHNDRAKQLETLVVLALGLWVIHYLSDAGWPQKVIPALLFVALFVKPLAKGITWTWLKITTLLGRVNGFILLTAIFYLVLTPLAVLRKLTKTDLLKLRQKGHTTFTTRDHTYRPEDFEKPW